MPLAVSRRETHDANDFGLANGKRGVWTERRIHAEAGVRRRIDRAMMREIVARIVGGADGAHFEFAQDALRREIAR